MKRHLLPPLMTTFDLCDTTLPSAKRDITTVAPQALALLNNAFSHDQSTALAKRIMSLAKSPPEQAALAWRFALGRAATPTDTALAIAHMTKQTDLFSHQDQLPASVPTTNATKSDADLLALTSLCHVLLNSNEFIYVD
jgi:hypothetical protein